MLAMMRRLGQLGLLAAWVVGCASVAPRVPTAGAAPTQHPPRRELWIDPAALEGGDGSARRPLRRLPDELLAPASEGGKGTGTALTLHLHLAPGLYRGPIVLPRGALLEGSGPVTVLFVEPGGGPGAGAGGGPREDTVISAPEGGRLEHLSVQGGSAGIVASGPLELDSVELSGQRHAAIRLFGDGKGLLEARQLRLEGSLSESRGLELSPGTRAVVASSRFTGAYRRAIQTEEAKLALSDCVFEGPVTGVHQVGGSVSMHRLRLSGGRGPALFVARGKLSLDEVSVHGHEYGLQTGEGAELDVKGFTSVRAERAGLGLVRARGRLEDVRVLETGNFGGMQLLESEVEVHRLRIDAARASGVVVRQGKIVLRDLQLSRIRKELESDDSGGDGVVVAGGEVLVQNARMTALAGAGVLATARARVEVQQLECEACLWGAVTAERGAQVVASDLLVRGGDAAAVLAAHGSRVEVKGLVLRDNPHGPAWADCASGATVRLSRAPALDAEKAAQASCIVLSPER